mgnify:CR=1 FL=1
MHGRICRSYLKNDCDPHLAKTDQRPGLPFEDPKPDPSEASHSSPLYTGAGLGWSPLRALLGVLALVVLVGLALSFSEVEKIQTPARVGPSHIFRVDEAGPARYQVTLYSGMNAGSAAMESQQLMLFEQSDLVELSLPENLVNGASIQKGEPLVLFRSPTNLRRLEVLKAQRDVLIAQRTLLEAGQRPGSSAVAERRLQEARARRQRDKAELERMQQLQGQGAVAEADLQAAELQDRLRSLQVSLERAELDLESAPVREEELEELDARLAATDAGLQELELLLAGQTVYSQLEGLVRLGGDSIVEVMASETIVIHLPIPQTERYRVQVGDPVEFVTQMVRDEVFEGSLIDIADSPELLGSEQVYWAAASIPLGDGLKIGMNGTARMKLSGESGGFLSGIRQQILGP